MKLFTASTRKTDSYLRVIAKILAILALSCLYAALHAGIKPGATALRRIKEKAVRGVIAEESELPGVKVKQHGALLVPTLSYGSPQTYIAGVAITPLTPTSSGVAPFAYTSKPTNKTSGFNAVRGVATDVTGNIYVADFANNQVKKIPAAGGPPVILGSGFNGPTGVAVDGAGNVYVSDYNNNAIKKIPVGGGEPTTIANINLPYGVAADAAGDVFVADLNNHAIKKIPAGGGDATSVGPVFTSPVGVAVDAGGNVYIADFAASSIKKIPAGSNSAVSIGSGLQSPQGVAVDAAGNVFVADNGHAAIKEIPALGGNPVTLASDSSTFSLLGVAAGPDGTVYIADFETSVKQIKPIGGYYINALPLGLKFDNATGIIRGTPVAASPAANCIITAYNGSGSSNTRVNIKVNAVSVSYNSSPVAATVNVAIAPVVPVSSQVAAAAYGRTSGFGGFTGARYVAADAAGNVYVTDFINSTVTKIFSTGGFLNIGSGFLNPTGIAVDRQGNVFVADFGHNLIKKIPFDSNIPVQIGTALDFDKPQGLALDAAGNLYIADSGNHVVKKLMFNTNAPIILTDNLSTPLGVAVDRAGNLYISSAGNGSVKKLPVSGGLPVVLGTAFSNVSGIAVDAQDNVYVADGGSNTAIKLPVDGSPAVTLSPSFGQPIGIAVDGAGNVFVADFSNSVVEKIAPVGGYYIDALPLGLSFNNNTGVISGTPAMAVNPAINCTVTAYNSTASAKATVNIKAVLPAPPVITYNTPQIDVVNKTSVTQTPKILGTVPPFGYNSAVTSMLSSTVIRPILIAVDALGNIYTANSTDTVVQKIPFSGGPAIGIGLGFMNITGVAVDKAGNVYVADFGHKAIKKIPAGSNMPVTIGPAFSSPTGIAVDNAGNVYVADHERNFITEIPANNDPVITLGSGFAHPEGVAVDPTGNVYVITTQDNNAIKMIPAGNGAVVPILTGPFGPACIAADAAGNIFVTQSIIGTVLEIPVHSNSSIPLGSGFSEPFGVAVDPFGNVLVTEFNIDGIKKIIPAGGYYLSPVLPAGLNFNQNTGIISGTPTALSPATDYTVTAYNAGGSGKSKVSITVAGPANNASLSKLTLSTGTLAPVFASATTSYTTSVSFSVTSIKITPLAADATSTIKVNGTAIASGTASANIPLSIGPNTIKIVVTARDGVTTKTYTVTVARGATNALLTIIKLSPTATLATVTGTDYKDYTTTVPNTEATVKVLPTAQDTTAVINVNGIAVKSGVASGTITLKVGANVINITVTAQDGVTKKIYSITVTRTGSPDALLTSIKLSPAATLTTVTGADYRDYTAAVPNTEATVKVLPTVQDTTAAIEVNGIAVKSGAASGALTLKVGANVINIVVTAQDRITKKTYSITVTRTGSSDALLTSIKLSPAATLTTVTGADYKDYTATVPNIDATVKVLPTVQDTTAAIKVNGITVKSGAASASIPLSVGTNVVNTIVTAQDGLTTKTYSIKITRAAPGGAVRAFEAPDTTLKTAGDGILVHQGLSPNGDGIADVLIIEGITKYPDNNLQIMNRNGALVYSVKSYDNTLRAFDGHSSVNGKLQQPGTYFYRLEYTEKGNVIRKTGYILIKY